ncbi:MULTISPECIES: ASCH domain-containing protein [Bacillus]|uniref:ASCH domain-containing protein n=1 Tax=Bacillus aerius TaxID=293388 RepID=A0AB39J916_9BACI|nr:MULTISPECIES: ASCH domain-containing protein [Bacillus]MBY0186436.1 ASCH domain-containing protein [Bacillus aerophilus]MCA0924730.1 ASCH domain-containing protein [Bacillus stratosphericus]AKC65649.1 RNA-binding protein [Bacillus altitudinis]ALM29711.1 RNA-binding protein [Bacillus altitudinis]ALM46247.1 RNA-binding protein [Bacillus altitudinis]
MNHKSTLFWESYWEEKSGKTPDHASVSAWAFGANPDHLLDLVQQGKKTATCSGYLFYEKEQEPLPKPGHYAVILDSREEPKAIIEITQVDIMPMNEVPESFAKAEGEGDLSYDYWYKEHEEFFTEALKPYGLTFKEDMLLVCERFKLVYSAS